MPRKPKPYSELSRTQKFIRNNPKSHAVKIASDKRRSKSPAAKAQKRENESKRREAIKKGVDTSKTDYDHAVGKRIKSSTNRARAEGSRVKGSKRAPLRPGDGRLKKKK